MAVVNRATSTSWLTANCDCWKGKEAVLANFSDAQIAKMEKDAKTVAFVANAGCETDEDIENAYKSLKATKNKKAILNEMSEEELAEAVKEKRKAAKNAAKNAAAEEEEEEEEEFPAKNKKKAPPTANEWLEQAPPEIQEVVRGAMQVTTNERTKVIATLTANCSGDKKALAATLNEMPLAKLKQLLTLAPAQHTPPTDNLAAFFGGMGGAAPVNNTHDADDVLVPGTINYAEAALALNKKSA